MGGIHRARSSTGDAIQYKQHKGEFKLLYLVSINITVRNLKTH